MSEHESNLEPGNGRETDLETPGDGTPLEDELTQALRQRDEYFEQLQKSRAEFANFQKRSKAQIEADRPYYVGNIALDVLQAIDNFERALEAAKSAGARSIVEGLELVHRQLLAALAKHGVEPISALGQPFDPNLHEAVMQQADATVPDGTVTAELARGYLLRDRVLRPTKVAVSITPVPKPVARDS